MDPFDILGVARDASDEDIRKAFKRLAHEHHPDRNPGDAEAAARFRRVKAAYDTIRGARRREAAKAPPQASRRARPARKAESAPPASDGAEEPRPGPSPWSTDDPTPL